MPGLLVNGRTTTKRKRDDVRSTTPRKAPRPSANVNEGTQARILLLEEQILASREHYNNIVMLQQLINRYESKPKTATVAAVALCRVFCRLVAAEKLVRRREDSDADAQVALWLKARLSGYVHSLLGWIGSSNDASRESTALTLVMRVVKEEVSSGTKRSEQAWRTQKSTFYLLFETLLEKVDAASTRLEFVENYLEAYEDMRFYAFLAMRQYFQESRREKCIGNAIDLLAHVEGVPQSRDQLVDWYGDKPTETHQLLSINAHHKVAQEAWLSIFRSSLTQAHRKSILNIATTHILPSFTTRIELLTDFLTDSFASGGALSLLALSSIFHLMTTQNLDYPDFYTKLYSLLDDDLLHSKHRSRFFRLLDKFLSSSHLPAALVASFIKRLARLTLQAPPGAIVYIIPWTYDLLKQHPTCTLMLHRPFHPAHPIYATNPHYNEQGMDDPFDMLQSDPVLTHAIDSSLWELETLQAHYHPNVATLARILGEQFTKTEYVLEDFLDYGYAALVQVELGKPLKKTPVVEWEIPRRIITAGEEDGDGLNWMGGLLANAMDCC